MKTAATHTPLAPPDWLDSLPDGCAFFDIELQLLYCNPEFAARFGCTADELTGQQLQDNVPEFAGSVLQQLLKQVIDTGRSCEADETIGRLHLSVRVHPVPEGVVALVADVTARRQLEDDLAEAALHGRMLLEHLPAIHWTVDRDLRITLSKGAGLEALGLSAGEVVGQTLWDYFQTRNLDHPSIRAHRRALSGQSVSYSDCQFGRYFQVNLEPWRNRQGGVVGVIGLALDVTEQRLAEQERASTQKSKPMHIDHPTPLPGKLAPIIQAKATVLIVDDEPFMRDVAVRALQGAGYQTRAAASGRDAIKLLSAEPASVQLIVLDLLMPEMDGWATLQALRGVRNDFTVLLTSGQPEEEVRGRCRAAQAVGYLAKPYTLEMLTTAVDRALRCVAK